LYTKNDDFNFEEYYAIFFMQRKFKLRPNIKVAIYQYNLKISSIIALMSLILSIYTRRLTQGETFELHSFI